LATKFLSARPPHVVDDRRLRELRQSGFTEFSSDVEQIRITGAIGRSVDPRDRALDFPVLNNRKYASELLFVDKTCGIRDVAHNGGIDEVVRLFRSIASNYHRDALARARDDFRDILDAARIYFRIDSEESGARPRSTRVFRSRLREPNVSDNFGSSWTAAMTLS
jgi:hypothetical protein